MVEEIIVSIFSAALEGEKIDMGDRFAFDAQIAGKLKACRRNELYVNHRFRESTFIEWVHDHFRRRANVHHCTFVRTPHMSRAGALPGEGDLRMKWVWATTTGNNQKQVWINMTEAKALEPFEPSGHPSYTSVRFGDGSSINVVEPPYELIARAKEQD